MGQFANFLKDVKRRVLRGTTSTIGACKKRWIKLLEPSHVITKVLHSRFRFRREQFE